MESPVTSRTLLEALRANEHARAWTLFSQLYSPFLYGIARGHGLSDADAKDVVQECLLRCVRAMPGFRYNPARRFRAWLRTVCKNVIRDQQRVLVRVPKATGASGFQDFLEEQAGAESAPDDAAAVSESLQCMLDAIHAKLTAAQWAIFYMAWVEELPTEEIARRTESTPNAIRQMKHRIICSLEELRDNFSAAE